MELGGKKSHKFGILQILFIVSRFSDTCKNHLLFFLFFKKDFIYLFMRDTEREAETQAEGEAGSMQEADV